MTQTHPVVTIQPGAAITIEPMAITDLQETDWEVGLYECCRNPKWGAFGLFLPLCMMCVASQRLGEHCCYPFCFGPLGMSARFRTLYRIRMTLCREGCYWMWCGMCMNCRLMNEMDARGCDRRLPRQ